MKAVVLILVVAALDSLPLSAVEFTVGSVGGSPIPIGAGPRALGMGGAFSAVADDVTAATWNPAGMAQLERPELGFSGGYYRIDSTADGVGSDRDEWRLDHLGGVLPFYVGGFQHAVGVAWQRQYDLTASVAFGYEETLGGATPQQVTSSSIFDRDGGYASLSASYALAITDTMNFGITASLWADDLTGDSASRARLRVRDVQETSTVRISSESESTVDAEVEAGFSLAIGGQWRALPQLSLSLVYKPSFDLDLEQRVRNSEQSSTVLQSNGAVIDSSDTETRDVRDIETTYPTSVTFGLGWRPNDLQLLSLDMTWTEWSRFATRSEGDRVSGFSSLLRPQDVDGDIAVRIGYEHLFILPRWVIAGRAGGLYERLPAMAPFDSLANPENAESTTEDWFGCTAGLTAFRRSVTYDVAVQLRWADDVGAGVYAAPDGTADVFSFIFRSGISILF